jgi:hypothetical protein
MAHMGHRKVYKVLVGKHDGNRTLEEPRHNWEDGIRMDFGAIEFQ